MAKAPRQQWQLRKRSEPAHPDTNPIVLGAASFKSLYLKRPYTADRKGRSSLVGASDTALRLIITNRGTLASDHFLFAKNPSTSGSRCQSW